MWIIFLIDCPKHWFKQKFELWTGSGLKSDFYRWTFNGPSDHRCYVKILSNYPFTFCNNVLINLSLIILVQIFVSFALILFLNASQTELSYHSPLNNPCFVSGLRGAWPRPANRKLRWFPIVVSRSPLIIHLLWYVIFTCSRMAAKGDFPFFKI